MMQAEQTRLEVAKSRLETEVSRRDALIDDLSGLGEAHEHYDSEHRELTESLRAANGDLEEAKKRTKKAVADRNAADDLLAALEKKLNSLMIDMTAAGKDLEAAENSITANDAAVAALEEQVGRSEELIVTLTEKLTDAKNRIEENRVSADALGGDIGELEKERKRVIEENLAVEKEQTEIRDRLRECNRQRETVLRDYTKA